MVAELFSLGTCKASVHAACSGCTGEGTVPPTQLQYPDPRDKRTAFSEVSFSHKCVRLFKHHSSARKVEGALEAITWLQPAWHIFPDKTNDCSYQQLMLCQKCKTLICCLEMWLLLWFAQAIAGMVCWRK